LKILHILPDGDQNISWKSAEIISAGKLDISVIIKFNSCPLLNIAAMLDGERVSKQLPVIRKALTCYKLLEVLLKEIECCPGLMTSQRIADGERCSHCGRTSLNKGEDNSV